MSVLTAFICVSTASTWTLTYFRTKSNENELVLWQYRYYYSDNKQNKFSKMTTRVKPKSNHPFMLKDRTMSTSESEFQTCLQILLNNPIHYRQTGNQISHAGAYWPTCLKMDSTPLEISPDGELAIHSSHDGVLKVWETATNGLKNEYKPSSHLSTTCSCLSWCQRSKAVVSCLGTCHQPML